MDYIASYLYQDTILHGLCLPFKFGMFDVGTPERTRRKEWVKQKLDIIGTGIFDARTLLDETPSADWLTSVRAAVEAAIEQNPIPYPTPDDAFYLYKGIHCRIVEQLRQQRLNPKHTSGSVDGTGEPSFDVLVYYPAHGSNENCVTNVSKSVIHGSVKNLNYVVSQRDDQNANHILEIKSKIGQHFKKSEKADQCDRIQEVSDRMAYLHRSGGLRALVSIKCARTFVWYELAYHYFQAAYTDVPSVELEPDSKCSDNCGMLALFPF